MKRLFQSMVFVSQILAARRHAEFLMAGPTRVWPEPGRPHKPEIPPDAVETPVYGPDVLLDGDVEWHAVSGCVCVQPMTRHLVCPAHPGDDE